MIQHQDQVTDPQIFDIARPIRRVGFNAARIAHRKNRIVHISDDKLDRVAIDAQLATAGYSERSLIREIEVTRRKPFDDIIGVRHILSYMSWNCH